MQLRNTRGYQCVCLHYHQCTLAAAGKIIQIKFSVLALYKGKLCQMVSSLLCQLVSNQIIELSAFVSVVVSLGTIDLRVETRDYRMNDLMILLITKKLISFWNFPLFDWLVWNMLNISSYQEAYLILENFLSNCCNTQLHQTKMASCYSASP